MVGLLPPAARRRIQLKGPQEVAGILEVLANSHDLVDDVLDADHAVLAKDILDDVIGRNGDTPTLNLNKIFKTATSERFSMPRNSLRQQ